MVHIQLDAADYRYRLAQSYSARVRFLRSLLHTGRRRDSAAAVREQNQACDHSECRRKHQGYEENALDSSRRRRIPEVPPEKVPPELNYEEQKPSAHGEQE